MLRTHRTRTVLLAACASSALLALAACSGGGASSASSSSKAQQPAMQTVAQVLNAATKHTQTYTSAKTQVTVQAPTGDMTMGGRISWRPVAMDFTMHNPSFQQAMGTSSIRVISAGNVMYENLGPEFAKQVGGKPWLKVDMSKLGSQGKAMADLLNQASTQRPQDPSEQIKLLSSEGAKVKRVGSETVDGVSTTHYTATVNVSQMIPKESSADVKKLLQQAVAAGVKTETIDLWLNSDNLPVQERVAMPSSKGTTRITMHYSDFSTAPAAISAPPASQTADISKLLGQ
ncbi:LolA-like protein [Phaeacidiphilus oryzae]|uniref:hypothetical protein n=1 Tax=Phaeacidiphilus oryzae TaxID=348818 RepID=UPI001269930C|nr:hypothetical protein [Phaeacidiphilus oryzae]